MSDSDGGPGPADVTVDDRAVATGYDIDVLIPKTAAQVHDTRAIEDRLRQAAKLVLDSAQARSAEITIALSNDEAVRSLNHRFRGVDKPTNVLAFSGGAWPGQSPFLGDVILARETIACEAAEQGKTFLDHATHLTMHGILHLLGYTHEVEEDAAAMEALEVKLLAQLGVPDPYAEIHFVET